jgi:hypothetical protein
MGTPKHITSRWSSTRTAVPRHAPQVDPFAEHIVMGVMMRPSLHTISSQSSGLVVIVVVVVEEEKEKEEEELEGQDTPCSTYRPPLPHSDRQAPVQLAILSTIGHQDDESSTPHSHSRSAHIHMHSLTHSRPPPRLTRQCSRPTTKTTLSCSLRTKTAHRLHSRRWRRISSGSLLDQRLASTSALRPRLPSHHHHEPTRCRFGRTTRCSRSCSTQRRSSLSMTSTEQCRRGGTVFESVSPSLYNVASLLLIDDCVPYPSMGSCRLWTY